jgi:hypothetical protein
MAHGSIRFRRDFIERALEPLKDQVHLERRRGLSLVIKIGAVLCGGLAWAWMSDTSGRYSDLLEVASWVVGILLVWLLWGAMGHAGRKQDKFNFMRDLLLQLQPELHPRRMIRLRFDLRHYDQTRVAWTRTSRLSGTEKVKYSDKWLRLRVHLADGGQLEIVRKAGVKVKGGSVVKKKRRLILKVKPGPLVSGSGIQRVSALESQLRSSVEESFHDAPEGFTVTAQSSDDVVNDVLKVKVVQMDAPILVNEVVSLIEGVYRHLYAA